MIKVEKNIVPKLDIENMFYDDNGKKIKLKKTKSNIKWNDDELFLVKQKKIIEIIET